MKPIRVTDGKYYDAIINFKNLDLISNLSFNGIIQSAQVENRMKDKLFKYFETQKSSCKSIYDLETKNVSNFLCQTRYYNHHFNDNLNDEFKYLYNLKRKCYDFLKNKTEDELLSSFQEFSIHPRDIPINDNQEKYFDSLGDYQKCIYQAWTSYNPETIVKIEEYDGRIYNWSPFDETMPFRKKIGASCISQNNCDFQKSRLSNNEDPILACENQFGFCSNSVECHDDDSKCFINTDKSGYGMKCDKHFCEVSYEDAENHFFNMSDNQRIIYKQNIKNYSIDIDSDKLGENVLYLGGSIDTYNTLIGYNYYRFARAKKSCDNCEPLDCNKHSDCDILKESNKVQYGCYDVSQDISSGLPAINHTEESISICSTPLSTIVNESKTIGESNGFELWFRANLIGSINTEDWNEGKNYLGIEFDTIFFSVIRQNSKTVLVDTFTYDNQHEATILNLNDIEGVPKIVTTYIINSMLDPSSQLSKALIFANIFDTKLKIFENINDKFDSLKYNLLSWIDKVFPADGVNGNLLKDISNIDDILSSNGLTISQ
jgi:hypothetical protein